MCPAPQHPTTATPAFPTPGKSASATRDDPDLELFAELRVQSLLGAQTKGSARGEPGAGVGRMGGAELAPFSSSAEEG